MRKEPAYVVTKLYAHGFRENNNLIGPFGPEKGSTDPKK